MGVVYLGIAGQVVVFQVLVIGAEQGQVATGFDIQIGDRVDAVFGVVIPRREHQQVRPFGDLGLVAGGFLDLRQLVGVGHDQQLEGLGAA